MKKLTALRSFDPSKLIVAHVGPQKPAPAPAPVVTQPEPPMPAWKRILAKRAAEKTVTLSASIAAVNAKAGGDEPFWEDGRGTVPRVGTPENDPVNAPKTLRQLVNERYPNRVDKEGTLYGDRYQNGVKPGTRKLEQFRECLTLQRTPMMRAQENEKDPLVYVKLFDPSGESTWFITEWEPVENEAFGLCYIHEAELGYMSLTELSEVRGRFGIGIEMDMHWEPRRLSVARAELADRIGGDGTMEHPPAAEAKAVEYVENPPTPEAVALMATLCAREHDVLSPAAIAAEEQEMGERLAAGIAKEEAANRPVERITVSINREHRGVEIQFPGKPDAQVRERMKANRFKYHAARRLWYTRASRESIRVATLIALSTDAERAALIEEFEKLPPRAAKTGGAS